MGTLHAGHVLTLFIRMKQIPYASSNVVMAAKISIVIAQALMHYVKTGNSAQMLAAWSQPNLRSSAKIIHFVYSQLS